jgi:3-deoxy-D-manno-octulosonic-acid transferase
MRILYNLGILIYRFLARLLSPFNSKARLWTTGMIKWREKLKIAVIRGNKYIWIHCASLGEFEQGRPLIEALRKATPELKIVLTFFSPSGYEVRKNYQEVDYVCYLPPDTPGNAEEFISILNPRFAIFVKYEFWFNYINLLYRKNIPVYLISGIFRTEQHFFKWYGSFFRRMLFMFSHIFVQDEQSVRLLQRLGITEVSLTGDTRFDRVAEIANSSVTIPEIALFKGNEKVLLAGSSWPQDEKIIAEFINIDPFRMKWIFAPHEIDTPHIEQIEKLISAKTVRFSQFNEGSADARVLIIDNIGMLSSAYRYSYIAAVGGGFGSGIHNILEAACWGVPVLFGPNHEKFREALDLLEIKGARTFRSFEEFSLIMDDWLSDNGTYTFSSNSAAGYVMKNSGATARILEKITTEVINKGSE